MILQALSGYYRRARNTDGADTVAPGYARLPATGEIVIDREGELVAVNPIYTAEEKSKRHMLVVPLPPKRSGSKPEPGFLYEKVGTIWGVGGFKTPGSAQYRFDSIREKHEDILASCADEGAQALLRFFEKRTLGSTQYEGVDTALLENDGYFVVFRLKGDACFIHERPAVMAAWESRNARQNGQGELMQCLVTGQMAPVARLHGNVAGFGKDKPTLVSFNQDSLCSFGNIGKQGRNAPVSQQAAFEYVTALNMLMANRKHCINLTGDKLIFWAERDAVLEENTLGATLGAGSAEGVLDEPQAQRVRAILSRLLDGGDPQECGLDADVRFYILSLTANRTRIVVRFFHEDSFGSIIENVMRHYRGLAVEGARDDYPSPYRLLLETAVQRKRETVPPTIEGALVRSIITGCPYPLSLYQAVLMRVRAEHTVSDVRAGIIKATLNRQADKEVIKMALDRSEKDAAYLFGRLFALIEQTQYSALGEVNSGVADKYLNSALATPQMVFPTLLMLNDKHMNRLRRDKPGYAVNLSRQIGQVMDSLGLQTDDGGKFVFPPSMDANSQGRFLLGYYHQKQTFYTKNNEQQAEDAAAPEADE